MGSSLSPREPDVEKALSPLDAVFLQIESPTMLAHVGGLQIFSLPAGASASFLRDLVEELRAPRRLCAPWNLRLKRSALSKLRLAVVVDHDVDLDYHVRHLALPQPGGERELGMLVSRLHSQPLSRRRPLWECHVIEGLEHRRFAIYTKIHHAVADGVTAVRLLTRSLSQQPGESIRAPWAEAASDARAPATVRADRGWREHLQSAREVAGAVVRMGQAAIGTDEGMTLPFSGPKSVLNTAIGPQRRFATQQFDLARLKRLGRAADATLNDVVLTLSSTALRRFLKEANALPSRPLVAGVPVSLRPVGDTSDGNAVAVTVASLATDVSDPRLRLQTIRASMIAAKRQLQSLSPTAVSAYTGLVLAPFVLQLLSGLSGRARPCFNVAVSNVPGPSHALYLKSARLEAAYPVSNPFDGQALNITCVSYNGMLNFGFTGCRDLLPGMQRLALYTGEALVELEAAFGIAPTSMVAALPQHAVAA